MDGKTLMSPSGIMMQPKPNPFDLLSVMTRTHSATTYSMSQPRLSTSSLKMTKFGWVAKAHSNARLDGSRPINLMKYQYFVLLDASVMRLAINVEYS